MTLARPVLLVVDTCDRRSRLDCADFIWHYNTRGWTSNGGAGTTSSSLATAPCRGRRSAADRARGRPSTQGSDYALSTLQRTAREAGLGLDEIALAREFDSARRARGRAAALRQGPARERRRRRRCTCTRRRARPAGATSRSSRRSRTWRSPRFGNLVTRAGDVPVDGSAEEARLAQAAWGAPGTGCTMMVMVHGPVTDVTATATRLEALLLRCTTGRSSWSASAGPARSCSS